VNLNFLSSIRLDQFGNLVLHDGWDLLHDGWDLLHDGWDLLHDGWCSLGASTIACTSLAIWTAVAIATATSRLGVQSLLDEGGCAIHWDILLLDQCCCAIHWDILLLLNTAAEYDERILKLYNLAFNKEKQVG
jgi:hypothetical protein